MRNYELDWFALYSEDLTSGFFEIIPSPKKVIAAFTRSNSKPNLYPPKRSTLFFARNQQMMGESMHGNQASVSFSLRLVSMPNVNRPKSGP